MTGPLRPGGRVDRGRRRTARLGHDRPRWSCPAPGSLRARRRSRRSFPPGRASRPARGGRRARRRRRSPCRRRAIRSRTPSAAAADRSTPDLAGRGVLDDVVERLLGDPVEDLLDRERQALREVALDDDRQADPALERGGVGLAAPASRPSCSRLPGRSSKISARISASASRWRSRSEPSFSLAAAGSRSTRSSVVRVTRVIEKSAWVTESWSSRARWARSWLDGQLAGLAAQVALESLALADVAGRRRGCRRTGRRIGHPDRADLDRDAPAVAMRRRSIRDDLLSVRLGDEGVPALDRRRQGTSTSTIARSAADELARAPARSSARSCRTGSV